MDIIEQARLLGKAIQDSEQYKNYAIAKENADNDKELQDYIGEFNLLRMQMSEEVEKEDKTKEKIDELNDKMREAYTNAIENKSMCAYNDAKEALDAVVNNMKQIIDGALMGEDPMTYTPASGCTGSCATCGGCH